MPTQDGKILVCAVDGGGVRAIIALEVLKYIEQQLGRPIGLAFDLCAGTSSGGFVALGTAHGMTAAEISAVYLRDAPKIFSRSIWQKLSSAATLNAPKYDHANLYQCAIDMLGGSTKMSDSRVKTMVTAYDIAARTPRFLSSWDTPDALMVDCLMSTSAAPSYFAPWHNMIDGGTVDNAPALSAIIEACRLYNCTVRDVVCLSIGTGSDMRPYDGAKAASWGVLSWIEPLLSIFMDGSSTLATFQMQRLLPDANVLRLQCDVAGDLAQMDNTGADNLANLQATGQKLVAQARPQIDAFLEAWF